MKQFVVFFLSLFLFSFHLSPAAENPTNAQGFQAGGAQEFLGVTKISPEISNHESTALFNLTCKDPEGTEFQEGQKGYTHCLEQSRVQPEKQASGAQKPTER